MTVYFNASAETSPCTRYVTAILVVQSIIALKGTNRFLFVQAKDVQSSTPLHIASTYGHPEVARLLLSSGCDMRALDSDLRTPLHKACQEGNEGVAFVLLEAAEEQFGQEYVRTVSTSFTSL